MSSGASAPEVLVDGLLDRLESSGYDTVETREVTSEDVTFSLPPWLREEVAAVPDPTQAALADRLLDLVGDVEVAGGESAFGVGR